MKHNIYYSLFIISFIYILLLTAGIPFYWFDYTVIQVFLQGWNYDSLAQGFEFAFRPVMTSLYFLFFSAFGVETFPFRITKALATSGVILFIYYFVKKNTEDSKIALIASIFYLTNLAVLRSVTLIYDSEVISQLVLLLAVWSFFKAYQKKSHLWRNIAIFMCAVYLALLIRESAKVFVMVVILFIFIDNWKKMKYFALPLSILAFLATDPGLLLGLESPTSGSLLVYLFRWFKINNLVLFLKYMLISCFSIFLILFYLLYKMVREKKIKQEMSFLSNNKKHSTIFFGLWFIITSILTSIVPMGDNRYAIVPLLPFTLFLFIFVGNNYKTYFVKTKKLIVISLIIILLLNIGINLGMSLKYRYGYGNFFIALDESYIFTEENYNDSIFVYTDSISHYYDNTGLYDTNNKYIEYNKLNNTIYNHIFFFSLHNTLQVEEKNKSTLEKTFIKGPHCFMLYGLGDEEIETVTLTKVENKDDKQIFESVFEEDTQMSRCSIELETRFFFPQDVEIMLVGSYKNVTITINPPVGKQKLCEYECPVLEDDKVSQIKINTDSSFLNKIIKGETHTT